MATLAEKRAAREERERVRASDDNQRAGSGAGAASGTESPTDSGVRDAGRTPGNGVSPDGGNRGDATGPGNDAPNPARGDNQGNRDPERITISDSGGGSSGRGDGSRGGGGSGLGGYIGDLLGGRSARGGDSSSSGKPAGKRGKAAGVVVAAEPDPRLVSMVETGIGLVVNTLASLRPAPLNTLWTISELEAHTVAEPTAAILKDIPPEWIAALEKASPYGALAAAVWAITYPRYMQERMFWDNVRAQQRAARSQPGAPVGGAGFNANGNRGGNEPHDAGTGSADPLSMFQ